MANLIFNQEMKLASLCTVRSWRRSIIMSQTNRTESAIPFEEVVARMRALLTAKAIDPSIDAERAWEMLEWSLGELAATTRPVYLNSAKAELDRAEDLEVVRRHGGFRRDATLLVTYALVKEFGADMLSDEGLRRLVACMREPVGS